MADSSFPITPATVAVPVLALMTLILDIAPLAWHIRNRNLAASSLVSWILLSNFMNMVNAFIWPTDNVTSWFNGSGLCDIEVKLTIAGGFGIVGSLLCIMRSLAQVLDTKRTILSPSQAKRHWKTAIDCLLCFGGPIYSMAIHYVVQPNRYFIFAISGCTISYDNSWPKLVLILIWPPILCLVAVYYSVLVVLRMHRYRKDFSDVLSSSNSNLTKSRFLRLFILSMALIIVVLPTQCYVLYQNSVVGFLPYSWEAVHGPHWNDIELFPAGGTVLFDRWIQIAVGFALFPFFGLGQDAQTMYRKWLLKIGFGKVFPCLHRQTSASHRQGSSTSGHAHSFGSRTRLLFHKKHSEGSMLYTHSHRSSVPPSVATLSPAESQRGFGSLPRISEGEYKTYNNPSNSSSPMLEKSSPPSQSSKKSWLNRFLIKTHLSAPLRLGSKSSGASTGANNPGGFLTNSEHTYHHAYTIDPEQ